MNPLRRTRTHRSVACLCLAVVLVAAFLPGFAVLDYAIPEPGWVLLPDLATPGVPLPSRAFAGVAGHVVPPLPGRAPPTPSSSC
jgi:hypothetical protein